jgi:hypothetical protein
MPLSFGGQYSETGYKLSSGADLNTLFCKNYTDVSANKTSLLLSDGQDLSDVFEKRHTVSYSGLLVSKGSAVRVVYLLSSTNIYYGGDAGIFGFLNGTDDTPINGPNESVRAIYARDTNNVYVGGIFTSVNTNTNMAYLARYTGTTFARVNTSIVLNGLVRTMSALDPSNVFIGGGLLLIQMLEPV